MNDTPTTQQRVPCVQLNAIWSSTCTLAALRVQSIFPNQCVSALTPWNRAAAIAVSGAKNVVRNGLDRLDHAPQCIPLLHRWPATPPQNSTLPPRRWSALLGGSVSPSLLQLVRPGHQRLYHRLEPLPHGVVQQLPRLLIEERACSRETGGAV